MYHELDYNEIKPSTLAYATCYTVTKQWLPNIFLYFQFDLFSLTIRHSPTCIVWKISCFFKVRGQKVDILVAVYYLPLRLFSHYEF